MAEQKEKWDADFFPETARQEAEGKTELQPSMASKGLEEIFFKRDGDYPGFQSVKIKDIPRFLLDSYREAASRGGLPGTYKHLTEQLFKAGGFDETVYAAFKKFLPEVEKATHWTEQVKLYEEMIKPYIGKLSMKKI